MNESSPGISFFSSVSNSSHTDFFYSMNITATPFEKMQDNDSRKQGRNFMEGPRDHDANSHSEGDGLMTITNDRSRVVVTPSASTKGHSSAASTRHDILQLLASSFGNILEWYDFSIYASLGDVLGEVFFPPQAGHAAIVESFAVFGGAFLMRPVGGVLLGYIGDRFGRKKALVISIFLMAFPTFAMGCLPGYKQIGSMAIVLLTIVRLLQGISVGGQLMSSLVFTLESHNPRRWGFYGSFVMAAANFGTLLGNIVGSLLRNLLTREQLLSWGWRVPFLSGIIVSISGFYLRSHGDEIHATHQPIQQEEDPTAFSGDTNQDSEVAVHVKAPNPLVLAFSRENRRSILAASLVPVLWSGGFYLSFVWMSIYTNDLLEDPLPHGFLVNCLALFISVCLLFPYAGALSDKYGRKQIMTIGGVLMGVLSPIVIMLIGLGNPIIAFFSQSLLGIALSLWGSPMLAWLVEAFEPEARLTSVAVGYNIAQAFAGGLSPAVATVLVDSLGPNSPGWLITFFAVVGIIGLRVVAPEKPAHLISTEDDEPVTEMVVPKVQRSVA